MLDGTQPCNRLEFCFSRMDLPHATNDLQPGGKFSSRMEAKDGSMGFDFGGVNEEIRPNEYLRYRLDDGREVEVHFKQNGEHATVTETFEPETQNLPALQQMGWQTILENFRQYVERQP